MSSVDNVTVEVSEPPGESDVSPPISVAPEAPHGLSPWRKLFLLLLAASVLVAGVFVYNRHKAGSDSIPTFTVARASFVRSLRLKGTTEAVQSRSIIAPVLAGAQLNSLVITKLVPAGKKVHRGDVLVEFDRQVQLKDAIDKQAAYQKLASQAAQSQAQEDSARAKDETELRQAESDLSKAELEMRRNEILSRIDVEKNQQNLEQAKAMLDQLRQTFDLKRRAAQAAIRILEIQSERAREDMVHSQTNADKMQIHSPIDGVVVLHAIWKQGLMNEAQEGDPVRPGMAFIDIVDPSTMQVRVQANQQDIAYLQVGQSAQVRLDAYPENVFPAKLEQLAPVGLGGNFSAKLHSFSAAFSIQGNDAKLMPDLSAAVDVQLERRDNVLLVPRESVVAQGGEQYVWVQTSLGLRKRTVKTGLLNDTEVVIESGLSPGDIIERNPSNMRMSAN